ncbi:hypothetical protein CHS0354_030544 [Potamilus streckersoni]|uniref:Uncharacterized protein n=1 Tax=Potamilus streckersoni TaxID=2493646 RepID=A0AAE0VGN5_9BIVA|nr:hypothetical protein CHS0354_030544 [Potamilus streckersoni]
MLRDNTNEELYFILTDLCVDCLNDNNDRTVGTNIRCDFPIKRQHCHYIGLYKLVHVTNGTPYTLISTQVYLHTRLSPLRLTSKTPISTQAYLHTGLSPHMLSSHQRISTQAYLYTGYLHRGLPP